MNPYALLTIPAHSVKNTSVGEIFKKCVTIEKHTFKYTLF